MLKFQIVPSSKSDPAWEISPISIPVAEPIFERVQYTIGSVADPERVMTDPE